MVKGVKLTEGRQNSERCRFLRFITKTQLIDSLHTEHIGFSFGQTADNKSTHTDKKQT